MASLDEDTVLVTGGSGFLGSWTVVELLRRGLNARATVRSLDRADAVRENIARQVSTERLSFAAANLLEDSGWSEAMSGVRYVLHVASPMPVGEFANTDVVATARHGVQRIFRFAMAAGVEKIVMTSSVEASRPANPDEPISESAWTQITDETNSYVQSKVLSERDAWMLAEVAMAPKLTTILPTFIQGPVFSEDFSPSIGVISGMLAGNMPAVPRSGFYVVDVRDLADLHVEAMLAGATNGKRIIGTGDYAWLIDVANILRDGLGEAAANTPTTELPDEVVRAAAETNPAMKRAVPQLGVRPGLRSTVAKDLLHWSPRPLADTILDCGRSLLELKARSTA